MSFIQNLQNKSDVQKKRILTICLVVFMVLIIAVWLLQIGNYSLPVKDETLLAPISEIKDEVVDMYNDSSEKIKNIKENIDNIWCN